MTPRIPAPIALFAYKRRDHLQRAVASLQANRLAAQSHIYVFSDGAKGDKDAAGVADVRAYLHGLSGFASVTIINAPCNQGLAASIIGGVSMALEQHDRVIVIEDDLVLSPYFLDYMNAALDMYADDAKVAAIHGYVYPTRRVLPKTFFLRGADCWGWATWRRAWAMFEPDGSKLLRDLKERRLTHRFDLDGTYPFTQMLRDQIAGRNDSWAIRWHASCFLRDCLTLYPGRSLVQNIGNDASGTHSASTDDYRVTLAEEPITLEQIEQTESELARSAVVAFFGSRQQSISRRVLSHLKRLLTKS